MAKAVFIANATSTYRDQPGERYHFPSMYLSRVAQVVGDWAVFFESGRGGGRGYYAVQRVERIVPDPIDSGHYYAILDRASELQFLHPVARNRDEMARWERGLPATGGNNASAVRLVEDVDFAAILSAGMSVPTTPDLLPRTGSLDTAPLALQEEAAPFEHRVERPTILTSRPLRDQAFSRMVRQAYRGRCALSGLEIRNGGGRPEVEAAHILPVSERGPDTVRNGLALSGTVHWMFDRGLIALDDDHTILIAQDSIADQVAERLLHPARRLLGPIQPGDRPHPAYLRWHRENCFKG